MKKILFVLAAFSVLIFAGCKNTDEVYYAENNIKEICPDLNVTKCVQQKELGTFIQAVTDEYMSALFPTANLGRAAKSKPVTNAAAAKEQVVAFLTKLLEVSEKIDSDDAFLQDIHFDQEINVADLETDDLIKTVVDEYNKQIKSEIEASDLTSAQKEVAFNTQKIDLNPLKQRFGIEEYNTVTESISFDRYYHNLQFDVQDKDKNKTPDYYYLNSDTLFALSVSDFNKIVKIFTHSAGEADYPVKAIAFSMKGDLGGECSVKAEKVEVSNIVLDFDISLSVAAVTKNGMGGYFTITVHPKMSKTQVTEFVQSCLDDTVTENMFKTVLESLGEIKIACSDGTKKKGGFEISIDIGELVQQYFPESLQGLIATQLN